MRMKKMLCLLLLLVMVLGVPARCRALETATSTQSQKPSAQELLPAGLDIPYLERQELLRAVQLGCPADKLGQATISGAEMAQLLDIFVEYAAPEKLAQWQTQYPLFRQSKTTLRRFDAMAYLYLAAQTVGDGYAECKQNPYTVSMSVNHSWEYDYMTWNLFGGFEATGQYDLPFMGKLYLDAACYYFNMTRPSNFSGEFPFSLDPKTNSFLPFVDPTYAECAMAMVRLICSEEPAFMGSPAADVADERILTPELIALANQKPEVTADNHPVWTGFTLGWDEDIYFSATAGNIRHLANWGFNSVRIMCDYKNLFERQDVSKGITNNLRTLDSLIAAAIESDMHLDLCLCKQPGRDAHNDPETYTSVGEFDLFINKGQQAKARSIWATLARRYKDIPSSTLTFTPIWEAMNPSMSTGLPAPAYTPEDVGAYLASVIAVIRAIDPDRLIICEPTPNGSLTLVPECKPVMERISKFGNVMISYNYGEGAFIYAHMNATEGEHIDNNNHSLPTPTYPVYYYGVSPTIHEHSPLIMTGCLPAGTVIDLYLEESFGTELFIKADGKKLYSEKLDPQVYDVSYVLSRCVPYATSNKRITVTLEKDTQRLAISLKGNDVEWSGMDVTLPDDYAREYWYYASPYDVFIGAEETAGLRRKRDARMIIAPTAGAESYRISIHEDLTYTTDQLINSASADTVNAWGNLISGFDGNCIVRFECAAFSGVTWDAIRAYYEDILCMYQKHGFSWWSNDFWIMTNEYPQTYLVAESPSVPYDGFDHFNLELLQLLQKYQSKR